jgi:hypothetical protein
LYGYDERSRRRLKRDPREGERLRLVAAPSASSDRRLHDERSLKHLFADVVNRIGAWQRREKNNNWYAAHLDTTPPDYRELEKLATALREVHGQHSCDARAT